MTLNDLIAVPSATWLVLAAVLGLVFGSFITALSYRVPRGLSIADGRSQCPACKTPLTPRDLIPVLSWLSTRGTCRVCGTKISIRYPLIEVLTAVTFVLAVSHDQRVGPLLLLLGAAVLMITLSIIDLEHRRLPLPLLIPLGVLAAIYGWQSQPDIDRAVFTAAAITFIGLAIAALTRHVLGSPLIGAGDVYALFIGALFLPWLPFLVFLWMAGVLALVFGLAWRHARHDKLFPFGPAVFSALWITLIFQGDLTRFVS